MKKILFVCHGNICRSVMAEYIMKNLDKYNKFYVESCATTTEEIGNDIYPPVKEVLKSKNIIFDKHKARQINENDYYNFDYIFCMDQENLYDLERILPSNDKTYLLSDNEIEDPWYTRDFIKCFDEIYSSILDLIKNIK